jgi:hypothetical protein
MKKKKILLPALLVVFVALFTVGAGIVLSGCAAPQESAGAASEDNAFIAEVNKAVAPILGSEIPKIPFGLSAIRAEGVVGEQKGFSLFGEAESRLLGGGANETRFVFVVDAKPQDVHASFTEAELASVGYLPNGRFHSREFGAGSPLPCKVSQNVRSCVWTECDAPFCVHTFFTCRKWEVNWIIESPQEKAGQAVAVDEELRKAFGGIC